MAIDEKVNPKDAELLEAGKLVLGTAIKTAEEIERHMSSGVLSGFMIEVNSNWYKGLFGAVEWYNRMPEDHPIRKEFKPEDVRKAAKILLIYAATLSFTE